MTIGRILREHRIHVITTEKPESISKYTFALGIRNETAEVRDIDADVFAIARNNYDSITAEMENQQKMILSLYDEISQEYDQLVQETYSALGGSAREETGVLKAA
ncbi:MAG: hypothetical protein M1133_14965 [Armatimonadetes bacterium]|nr:hypothetical protein [Armatimonadota bacterium]